MTRTPVKSAPGAVARRGMLTSLAALGLAVMGGCDIDRLLRIETPSRVAEARYLVPENAGLIVSGAIADFECALGTYVVTSGLAAGELVDGTLTASRWSYDRRGIRASEAHYSTFGCVALGVYTPVNVARYTNDQAWRALSGWTDAQVPNRQRLISLTASLAGYSANMLGEGFCTAVIDVGPELSTAQLFDSAEVRFTTAITAAQVAMAAATASAQDTNLLRLAYAGRARARRNAGNLSGAGADAALVPTGFVYHATAGTNAARRNNRIFQQNNSASAVSVAPRYRAMTVTGEVGAPADPRVVAVDAGRNPANQVTRLWWQQKYGSLTAPTPIASGIEAQLILAEAQGGAGGLLILDQRRIAAGIQPLTVEERADFPGTLLRERDRWLWLQGNRWFDVRKSNLPLVPATGSDYPNGGEYGDQRCWPLPDVERLSNPNIP